jgi:hypothetical protein
MSLVHFFAAPKMESQPVELIAANLQKPSSGDDRISLRLARTTTGIDDCRFQRSREPTHSSGTTVDRNPEGTDYCGLTVAELNGIENGSAAGSRVSRTGRRIQ